MTTTLYAQPYDISAVGFYFRDPDEYTARAAACRNDLGQPVEEFEIQFIDGEAFDCALAVAWGLNQANHAHFLAAVSDWDDDQKRRFIVAVGECGYAFDPERIDPDDFDVDFYGVDSLTELAEQFVDEGFYGEIPDALAYYIDHVAIARDLSAEFSMIEIAGERFAYACR
ncbi:MAG: antirestriction protein ArdA [Pseudomonadota bacterium]